MFFCFHLQKQLCDKLEEQLQNLDASLKKKERAERRWDFLLLLSIKVLISALPLTHYRLLQVVMVYVPLYTRK